MSIPIEIQEIAIDVLHDDPSSLRACALVCHAWLPRSRLNLFRSISLHPGRSLDNLFDLFQEKPFIRSFVEQISVSLRRGDESTPTLFETIPIRLITELPNIRAFTFRDESRGATPPYISFRPLALACFKQYSSVETLHIGPLVFPTCSHLVRLVAAFPSLRHPHLVQVEVRDHRTAQVGLDMAIRLANRRIGLRSLDVSTNPARVRDMTRAQLSWSDERVSDSSQCADRHRTSEHTGIDLLPARSGCALLNVMLWISLT